MVTISKVWGPVSLFDFQGLREWIVDSRRDPWASRGTGGVKLLEA